MNGLARRLHVRINREKFDPGLIGLMGNPFYLIRRPLHAQIARLSTRTGGRILDFGCGSKPYHHLFTHADEYIGLDIAQSGHDHKNSQVDVFYDGSTIPFGDGSFDTVVAFEVFEHVFNLPEVLSEIHRVLRPGSQLLISLPFAWDEHEQPYDFGRYTSFGLRHVLEQSGFDVVELVKSGNYVSAVWQLWIAYLHQLVSKRAAPLKLAFQFGVVFPVTLAGLLASKVLPRSDQLYSNLVVLARKREQQEPR